MNTTAAAAAAAPIVNDASDDRMEETGDAATNVLELEDDNHDTGTTADLRT